MLKVILDKQDSIFWKHISMFFSCYKISSTKHVLSILIKSCTKSCGIVKGLHFILRNNIEVICRCSPYTDKTYHCRNNYDEKNLFPSTFISSQISLMLLLKQFEFYSSCLWGDWRSLDSFDNDVSGSQYSYKKVSKKNRVMKVFSGKSLDFSLWSVGLRDLMWGNMRPLNKIETSAIGHKLVRPC